MEAIRISCAGYPTRKTFDEFVDRFSLLAPEALDGRYLNRASLLVIILKVLTFFVFLLLVLMRSLLARGF